MAHMTLCRRHGLWFRDQGVQGFELEHGVRHKGFG